MRRKLLALLLAAAMAIGLLAGCGGKQQSVAQALLALLDDKYQNVSVELDPDLEADLRQVLSENETDDAAAIRAALEKLVGSTVTFRNLGDGQQGDTTFDLVFFAGTDPDKAAQAAYTTWNTVFATLPDDGKYGTDLAMVQTDNGIWMLVKATVEKAGTEDKPEPVTLKSIEVTKKPELTYWVGESFDPAGMEITATYSNNTTKTLKDIKQNGDQGVKWTPEGALTTVGTQEITITYGGKTATVKVTVKESTVKSIEVSGYTSTYTEGQPFNPSGMTVTVNYTYGAPKTITGIKTNGDQGVTWTPADGLTTEIKSVKVTYTDPDPEKGSAYTTIYVDVASNTVTGKGFSYDKNKKEAKITESDGLENLFNAYLTEAASADITLETSVTLDENWRGRNITFNGTLTGESESTLISITGPSAQGLFNEIGEEGKVLNVDIEVGTISNPGGTIGAVAGTNYGEISGCDVTIKGIDGGIAGNAGGVVGWNYNTISDCTVTITGTISGTGLVGGVAGYNEGQNARIENCRVESGTIQGSSNGAGGAGGIVGDNRDTIQGCSSAAAVTGGGSTGGIAAFNYGNITACYSTGEITGTASGNTSGAGGVVGQNGYGGTVTACYHATGTVQGGSNIGGVVGYNDGTINDCYWRGYDGNGIGRDNTGNYNGFNENKEEHEKYYIDHNNKVTTVEVWDKLVAAMDTAGYILKGSYPTPTGLTPKN